MSFFKIFSRILMVFVFFLILSFSIMEVAADIKGDYFYLSLWRLKTVEKVFEKDNKKVHLIGMIHVGTRDYYEELTDRKKEYPEGTSIVSLLEGISYEKLGNNKDPEISAAISEIKKDQNNEQIYNEIQLEYQINHEHNFPNGKYADINIMEYSEKTIKSMASLQKYIESVSVFLSGELNKERFSELLKKKEELEKNGLDTAELFDKQGPFLKEVIYLRNDKLWSNFEKDESSYDVIYIPWGSSHMPDIERRLLDRGYYMKSRKTYVSLDLFKVLIKFVKTKLNKLK